MNTELVRFTTEDGLTLEGLLFTPKAVTKNIIIHVHGSAGNFYENVFVDTFAKRYTEAGYAFFAFNTRGAGFQREYSKLVNGKKQHVLAGMLHEIFEECVFDIDGAINYSKTKGFSNVVISGHSLGCNKVVWYAIEKKFKGKLILLAPCDLARENNEEQLTMREKARLLISQNKGLETIPNFWGKWNISALTLISVWSDNVNADMFRYRDGILVKKLSQLNSDIIIQIGTLDQCIIQSDKQECVDYLYRAMPNANITSNLIDGVRHHYTGKENEVMDNILNWLKLKS